mgnify:CR=1 FL=1
MAPYPVLVALARRFNVAVHERTHAMQEQLGVLNDSSYEVAVNAARVLGGYSDAGAVAALAGIASDSAHHRSWTATESLGRIGSDARSVAPLLLDIVLAQTRPVALRGAALESLARVDSAAALPLASDLAAASDWRLRASAARALALLVDPADPRLLDLVREADSRVAGAALQALLDAAGDDLSSLRPLLVERLGSPDVMVRSIALGGLGRLDVGVGRLPGAVPEIAAEMEAIYGAGKYCPDRPAGEAESSSASAPLGFPRTAKRRTRVSRVCTTRIIPPSSPLTLPIVPHGRRRGVLTTTTPTAATWRVTRMAPSRSRPVQRWSEDRRPSGQSGRQHSAPSARWGSIR